MKNSKQKQWLSFLLALIMLVGLLPFSVLSVGAESGGEETISTSREPARASSRAYPRLTNLAEGTEIIYGYVYFFYKSGRVESLSVALDPEDCRYNKRLLEGYKSETGLQRVVSYDNGILMYWTRFENDFLDLSGLEGRSLTLILFDDLKLSSIYAPGVDLKLMVTDGVHVTLSHSTRYKNKTAYCPQNGATGAVIDLAQSEGSLNGCGTFELCGNGKLSIVTTNAPRKTSPDYAIVAKNTSVLEDAALHIVCGNSHRDVSSLIQTITLTIDTTRDVSLHIKNPRTNAAAWSCHMNNFKLLNAKSLNVYVQRGSGGWILFGNNGETDPAKVFKNYRSSGKIGREWYIAGRTDSSGYNLTLDRRDYMPQIRFNLNLNEVKGGQTVRGLKAGLGYEMSADIVYMPQWMQKLRDAGRVRFDFYGLLCKPGQEEGYEGEPYTIDFYVDRTGKHGVEFYWACWPSANTDYSKPKTEESVLYQTHIEFDVQMNESVSGKQYIYNVQLLQAGGEFTEATNATHKISLHPDTLAKCYTDKSYSTGIPSEWRYRSDEDAYTMYFWINARHGYELADSTATADNGVTLNVQHTKVTNRSFTYGEKALTVNLVAKRKLTDVRGTLKNFRLGIDAGFTEIVSNEPKKYTFKNTVVYDVAYGSYGVEAGQLREGDTCYVYFDVKPGVGYYLPENASVKVIQPAGYRANGIFDSAETYSTVYKGDWYDYSPIGRKYRVSQLLEPNSEGVKYDTNIRVQEPKVGDRPAVYGSYIGPTNLPYNMKVLSMQWRKTDHAQTPMGSFDRFEIGESYILDLRIGFEGGEEKGYVYPKNWKEFKVNGKSVNAWMEYDDNTNGHFLRVYESYKVADPSASGSVSGTVKSSQSATDKVTIQLIQQGYTEASYETIVSGGTKEGNQYTASYSISGIASGTYTMRVMKNKHVTREYTVTVSGDAKTQNAEIWLLGDVNGDGIVNIKDCSRLLKHVNKTQLLSDAYALKCANTNGDSTVNIKDCSRLLKHVNKTQPLW